MPDIVLLLRHGRLRADERDPHSRTAGGCLLPKGAGPRIMSKEKKSKKKRVQELPGKAVAFESHDALLEGARRMFEARAARAEAEKNRDEEVGKLNEARSADNAWRCWWHRSVEKTARSLHFARVCRSAKLDEFEREVLVALVLGKLSLITADVEKVSDLVGFLGVEAGRKLEVMRRFLDGGKLLASGRVRCSDLDAELPERCVQPESGLIEEILGPEGSVRPWSVGSEVELHQQLYMLTSALRAKADAIEDERDGWGDSEIAYRHAKRADRLVARLQVTLAVHPEWEMNKLFTRGGLVHTRAERLVLLALIGRELGHLGAGHILFRGDWLAFAASRTVNDVPASIAMLTADARLARRGLIAEVDGRDLPESEDHCAVENTRYRLGERARKALGISERRRSRSESAFSVRDPVTTVDALVLDEQVQCALLMAQSQARNGAKMLKRWGLGDVVPYGNNVTLLFAGSPGVGKTACAEALARELGKSILVVDYSQVQNCWLGETEKNIVEVFREARRSEAVLFWDEADGMLHDRNYALRSWEVRSVNVLLQELERFDGVCVLATNRRVSLDPAVERRITIKVEFRAPDRAMRRRIWEKMLGGKLPLASDVDLDWLSEARLTGGQIKNVVLNAARLALAAREERPVSRADFEEALKMEKKADEDEPRERMGF